MGPLAGLRIVEIAGIGPGPFCGMMLADNGAEVVRITRPASARPMIAQMPKDILNRSRKTIAVDLKSPDGVAVVRRLCQTADGLIEGNRPGVMERLGLGPDVLLKDNPHLVYGRMTGWGQTGPYSGMAGHDINYIAITGALAAIGRAGERPVPPLNLVGDFGGGGLLLAFGMVSAILQAQRDGIGQVVDCAMTDGAAVLMAMIYSFRGHGQWHDHRGGNLLDGGAPFYDTYETSDGHHIALGAIEPQFFAELVRLLGVEGADAEIDQLDEACWPELRAQIARAVRGRSRAEWCTVFDGRDACVAPVMSLDEAPGHAHNQARETFITIDGVVQPAPAPRYSATPNAVPQHNNGDDDASAELLSEAGYSADEIADLRRQGAIG